MTEALEEHSLHLVRGHVWRESVVHIGIEEAVGALHVLERGVKFVVVEALQKDAEPLELLVVSGRKSLVFLQQLVQLRPRDGYVVADGARLRHSC